MCCFTKAAIATNEIVNTHAYALNCKARFTNLAGATITSSTAGTWWCSYDTGLATAATYIKYEEMALINCRQLRKVCGGNAIILNSGGTTLADKTEVAIDRTILGLTA